MSIWSSFGGVEPLYKTAYGWDPADIEPGSWLDFAHSGHYGGNALRVCLENGHEEVDAVVSREQVAEIIRQLQDWLARTA